MLLLENVCRNGRKIGSSFSELKEIIDKSKYSGLIGICIDTAHLYAYGYELEKEDGFKKMVSDIKKSIGINKLKLFHFNDTLSLAGSQVDRHYHIGKGRIGIEGFKRIISFKKFSSLPAIIETPKEAKFTEISKKDIENIKLLKKISVDIKSDRSMMRIIS